MELFRRCIGLHRDMLIRSNFWFTRVRADVAGTVKKTAIFLTRPQDGILHSYSSPHLLPEYAVASGGPCPEGEGGTGVLAQPSVIITLPKLKK